MDLKVPKKEDSKENKRWRIVLDFRALNEKTIGDAYSLPNIIDILDQLGGTRYFSIYDLASGFQIKMDPIDSHKTTFTILFGLSLSLSLSLIMNLTECLSD